MEENKVILKELIRQSKLSQRQVAEIDNTTEAQVSKWISGNRNIKTQRLQALAKKMGFILKINYEILAQ